ncbi:MAG: NADH-quinone oxidoreductase subunit J [Methylohalobius crimeensis]
MTVILFYLTAAIAITATWLVITRANAVHALLYLIVSLLATGFVFFLLGAYFAALLEVIVYAGAVMVLFLFVLMMLDLGRSGETQERRLLQPRLWFGPSLLCGMLLGEWGALFLGRPLPAVFHAVSARQVGLTLLGPYVLAVELASMLLLAGLVGALHLTGLTPQSGVTTESGSRSTPNQGDSGEGGASTAEAKNK